jgi:methylmalonyl-CoA/ethylmalonyl-CoA epimerase
MESAATSAPQFGLSSIGQIGITVTAVDRALAFYRDTLGMKLLFQVPNMAFFDCAVVRLMLSGSETPGETYSSILYFKVPDIRQAFHTLTARGLTFERDPHLVARMPDHELWMCVFHDTEGNLQALMSEVR